jgi:hypothetical protein
VFVWRPLKVDSTWVWLEHVDRVYTTYHSEVAWWDVLILVRSDFEYRLCETKQERNERILRGERREGDNALLRAPIELTPRAVGDAARQKRGMNW